MNLTIWKTYIYQVPTSKSISNKNSFLRIGLLVRDEHHWDETPNKTNKTSATYRSYPVFISYRMYFVV